MRATGSLLAVVGEAVILSVGTPQPNPPGGVRVGEAVFASVWTPQLIPPGGLMAPDAVLPLYRLHIHTCDSSQATHTLWSHVCIRWVLWRFVGLRSVSRLRMRTSSSKPWETAHKQGMQGHDIIHQSNSYTTSYNLRGACNGRRLRIYGFTDLPPSLPLFPSTPWTRTCKSSYRRDGGV